MTAATQTVLHSRCPLVVDESTGRRCNLPAVIDVPSSVLIPELDMMRHTICCEDSQGHCWATNWSTDHVLT